MVRKAGLPPLPAISQPDKRGQAPLPDHEISQVLRFQAGTIQG